MAYKVRKDPIFTPESPMGVGVVGGWGIQEGYLSAQRGVNFSVVVSLVLFLFLFVEKWGWGWSVLWRCVVVWDWWVG